MTAAAQATSAPAAATRPARPDDWGLCGKRSGDRGRSARGARCGLRVALLLAVLFGVLTAGVSVVRPASASAATLSCPNGATMSFVAHEDDSVLFLSPDLVHD